MLPPLLCSRAAIAVAATAALLLSPARRLMAEDPAPHAPQNPQGLQGSQGLQTIECNVVFMHKINGPDGGSRVAIGSALSVALAQLSSLPATPAAPEPPAAEKGVASGATLRGTITVHEQTREGEAEVTYDGSFTDIRNDERYRPLGNIIILTPETWWPAINQTLEACTATLPEKHLRAMWLRPVAGGNTTVMERYFSVAVQVYQRQSAMRYALFTGTKRFRLKNGVMELRLTGSRVAFTDTPWIDNEHFDLKCAAIKCAPATLKD